jgi:hypothetical protein
MEIKSDGYHIIGDPTTTTITFRGVLRLRGVTEYDHIVQLLNDMAIQEPNTITLDLRELQFLNSSGINVLFRFVIKIREQATSKLIVHGSSLVPWQQKSLQNLRRLMAEVQLQWDGSEA